MRPWIQNERRSRRRDASCGGPPRKAGSRSRSRTAPATTTGRSPRESSTPARTGPVAALRETAEEIGQIGKLGPELPPVRYQDRKGRDKVVRYWLMKGGDAPFTPNEEVDEVRWTPLEKAADRLTYRWTGTR
jgi:hypothetical protein